MLLGEAQHGSNTSVAARGRLVKFLHERMGFGILAYEASFYSCARAWKARTGGTASFVTLAFGFSPRRAPWAEVADGFLYLPTLSAGPLGN